MEIRECEPSAEGAVLYVWALGSEGAKMVGGPVASREEAAREVAMLRGAGEGRPLMVAPSAPGLAGR